MPHPPDDMLEDLREPDFFGRAPESLIYDKKAPHSCVRYYLVLDRHLNKKTKACYPGYNRIQALTGMGKSTQSQAIQYLENHNPPFIRVIRSPQKPNRYQLMPVKGIVLKRDNHLYVPKQDINLVLKQDSNQRSFNQRGDSREHREPKGLKAINEIIQSGGEEEPFHVRKRRALQHLKELGNGR